ncbi:MAG: DUF5939 domain-containing protein [Nannocystaceae bacterium]
MSNPAAIARLECRADELAAVLDEHPWPPAWTEGRSPLDFLWVYELPAAPAELWPHLADSSAMNRRMQLTEMELTERDGRLHGRAMTAGFLETVWVEEPWVWEYGRSLACDRVYSKGLMTIARVRVALQELEPGRTRLLWYTGAVPRGLLARWLIKLGMRGIEAAHQRVMQEIIESVRVGRRLAELEPPPIVSPEGEAALATIRERLVGDDVRPALIDALVDYVRAAPDDDVSRVRVRPLARRLGCEERELLSTVLRATRAGLFTLSWDIICPHCRGMREELPSLGAVPEESGCEACGIRFDATEPNIIEVTFRVHPVIRASAVRHFCSAEPATKPHIVLQTRLEPGERRESALTLRPGRYRLRVLGDMRYEVLDVVDGEPAASLRWDGVAELDAPRVASTLQLALENPDARPRLFVLEAHDDDRDILRPADLFNLQLFRDLFSEEAVATGMQLDVGVQTVLFTDIVGSTALYERDGDARAFAAVRDHFIRLYELVPEHRGVIVKTIGDAAMAAFASPIDAVRAALAIQRAFSSDAADAIRVRVSIHQGPCLAVNLNAGIDYFGRVVNLAAKLQALAAAHQIVFSAAIGEEPAVAELLAAEALEPEALEYAPPGPPRRTLAVQRVTLPRASLARAVDG